MINSATKMEKQGKHASFFPREPSKAHDGRMSIHYMSGLTDKLQSKEETSASITCEV